MKSANNTISKATGVILLMIILLFAACQPADHSASLKPIVDAYLDAWNTGELDDLDQIIDADFDEEVVPAFCVAFASISGMLDEAESEDDLDRAVKHGLSLMKIGTATMEQFHTEVQAVFDEVAKWGEKAESELN